MNDSWGRLSMSTEFLSLWPIDARFIIKSMVVPENPLFSLFLTQKHKGSDLILQ